MSKMPPVPPEQRSPKGTGSDPKINVEDEIPGRENFDSQGRHGKHQAEHDQPRLSAGSLMPRKNPNTERFGGPGSSKQDRNHPEKFHKSEGPRPGQPPAVGNRRFPAGVVSGTSITRTTQKIKADRRRSGSGLLVG
jgi:hypothetical protein